MAEKHPAFPSTTSSGEIEKAEDAQLNKGLPQEPLKNKRPRHRRRYAWLNQA